MGSLSTALSTALQGMDVTQRQLSLTSTNVANAGSDDYTRKVAVTSPLAYQSGSSGIEITAVERQVDIYVQKQLRYQTSEYTQATTKLDALSRLEEVYGTIDSDSSLQKTYDNFVNAIQQLNAAPDDQAVRQYVLNEATNLAQRLNDMTDQVQFIRTEAETAMSDLVDEANLLLEELETVNNAVKRDVHGANNNPNNLDRRDNIISKLAEMMDIRVIEQNDGGVLLHTAGGATLFSQERVLLEFDGAGVVNAYTQYSQIDSQRNVGTVSLTTSTGSSTDLLADGIIRSGQINAYREMRDEILVEAQDQLDHMAHYLAKALSDVRYTADSTNVGGDFLFELDTTAFPENGAAVNRDLPEGTEWTVNFDVTTANSIETSHTIKFIHNSNIASPGFDRINQDSDAPYYEVITLDMTDEASMVAAFNSNEALSDNGLGFVVAGGVAPTGTGQIQTSAQVGPGMGFAIQDMTSAVGASLSINSMSMSVIATQAVQNSIGNDPVTQLPFFTLESGDAYQGITEVMPNGEYRWQKQGFAGRIVVNPLLEDNLAALNVYDATSGAATPSGNTDRVLTMLDGLVNTEYEMGPNTGIGAAQSPFKGTLGLFTQQIVSKVGYQVAAQTSMQTSVETTYNAINERHLQTAGVSVDEEMAMLIELQQAFSANAKIVQATDELMQQILQLV